MAKKKTYKLAEHEKYQHRVDVFRSVLPISNNNQEPTLTESRGYINRAYVTSNQNLNKPAPSVWTISSHTNDYSSSPVGYKNKKKYYPNSNDSEKERKAENKNKLTKLVILITACILVIIIVVVAVVLGIFLNKKLDYTECLVECSNDRFCLKSRFNNSQPTCECKPGYYENSNKTCQKSFCYQDYYPYTYINNLKNASTSALDFNQKFIKPYCCPNSNSLTTSCCGVSFANKTFRLSSRIIGGQTIDEGVFPWVVYLVHVYRSSPNLPLQILKNCSGSLISDRWVLTAAHCVDLSQSITLNDEFKTRESIIRVYFGFIDKTKIFNPFLNPIYERRSLKIIVHPIYNQFTLENDLALIELDKPVERSFNVDFICLFKYDLTDSIVGNLKLYAAGWGTTNKDTNFPVYPDILNYVDATIFPIDSCKYLIPDPEDISYVFNPATHVCAGYSASEGKDTCNEDSGGPLMVQLNGQWFIYGIVSFGSYPLCADGPAMYIRISYYYNWIKYVTS